MNDAQRSAFSLHDAAIDGRTVCRPDEFYFTLPESFNAADFLPLSLRRHQHNAQYLVSTILRKLSRLRRKRVVYLQSTFLQRMMGDRYAAVIESLVSGGAVHRLGNYEVGRHSFAYKLDDRFMGDAHMRVPVKNLPMLKRLKILCEEVAAEMADRLLPVHRRLIKQQRRLSIDGMDARAMLCESQSRNPFDCQGILVRDIEDGNFRLTVGRYGRVSNNITSLWRTIRGTLRVNEQPLGEVDMRCAQPALLGLLIWAKAGKCALPKTHNIGCVRCSPCLSAAAPFLACVREGCLYDVLMSRVSPGLGRSELKRRLLRDVFAKRGYYPSPVEDAFRQCFPEVHAFIREINRDNHANLIRLLQRLESHVVVERICGRLTTDDRQTFVLTLHDAILTTADGIPLVEAAFEELFREFHFSMKLKVNFPSSD